MEPLLRDAIADTRYTLKPIGVIRSPHSEAKGTPIQPRLAGGYTGVLEVFPEYVDGLADIDGFSRVWLIYWLHRIAATQSLRVIPYRDLVPRGVFATRAPARPNPIGMSPLKLIRRDGHRLFLEDVDLLDGTPILDIKPYVSDYDSYSGEKSGWIGQSPIAASVTCADERFHQG